MSSESPVQPRTAHRIGCGGLFFLCLPWIIGLALVALELKHSADWSHAVKLTGVVESKTEWAGGRSIAARYLIDVRVPPDRTSRELGMPDYYAWQRLAPGDQIQLSYLPTNGDDAHVISYGDLRVQGEEYDHTLVAGLFFCFLGAMLIAGLVYTQHKYR